MSVDVSLIPQAVEAKFRANFTQTNPDDCWNWTGNKNYGYGVLYLPTISENERAHRISWMLANRRYVPRGKFICHTCDNPSCVNPAHLVCATPKWNMVDKTRKGRTPTGSNHYRYRLNPSPQQLARRARDLAGPTDQILTRAEAMTRAKITNPTSFFRWRKEFGLRPISRNRYALRAVDKAIEREARGTGREARL